MTRRPTKATVSLGAIQTNLAAIREMLKAGATPPQRGPGVIAVVKANAYGHGAVAVGLALESAGLARVHVFVIGNGAAAVGLVVDRIVGQREIVVRSTVDPLIRVSGVAGATDLGDGRVVLILDAAALALPGRGAATARAATA